MSKAVRDPLLPFTHYQRLGKKASKGKSGGAIWVVLGFILFFLGVGGYYLHNEIESLKKETEVTPLPTISEEAEPTSIPTPATTVDPNQVTGKPTLIPTIKVQSTIPVSSDTTVCTQDAQLCPDGSYVGRTGPKCEFKCP